MKRILFLLTSYFLLLTPAITFAQSVDLLWQGDAYTPPFYQGHTQWSKQSKITLLAIPNSLGNPSALSYRWVRNGTVLGSLSGIGKNTFTYTDTIISRSQNFRVEITAVDDYESPILAQAFLTLTPSNPTLVVYENNPLYGFMFHREVSGTYPLNESEVTFAAFPLFFSVANRADGNLTYKWQTNTGETESKNAVTYRAPEGSVGTSAVYVDVANQNKIMQAAKNNFLVQFGNNE